MINEILLQQARRELDALADDQNIRRELVSEYFMAMDNNEKQAAYVARMNELNYKRVAVWLSPESQEKIEQVQEKKGLTRDKAIEYLILRK